MRRVVYITPSLYIAGGVERVLTTKANYLADVLGYSVVIILTDGKDREPYFPLSQRVKVINLDIGFEEMWRMSFLRKIPAYLCRQWLYRLRLKEALMDLRPDITVSLGRREVNFLCDIKDGSRKICEIHVNRSHYRNFEGKNANWFKNLFAKFWMRGLIRQLKHFDKVICLTPTDAAAWKELDNVIAIPNPLPSHNAPQSDCKSKRAIAVGRYTYEKGFDMLLKAWQKVHDLHPDWQLDIYGTGNRKPYQKLCEEFGLADSCHLNDAVQNILEKYAESSILVVSSRFEGFGMTIIEAMQCGVPVVSFDCQSGPRNIITDGQDGLLVKDSDCQALAEKLCFIMENKDERLRMSQNAKKKAKHYCVENVIKNWTEIYDKICIDR